MAEETRVIEAEFFTNGTCGYRVIAKDGTVIDYNIVGIVTNWTQLFRVLGSQLSEMVAARERLERASRDLNLIVSGDGKTVHIPKYKEITR